MTIKRFFNFSDLKYFPSFGSNSFLNHQITKPGTKLVTTTIVKICHYQSFVLYVNWFVLRPTSDWVARPQFFHSQSENHNIVPLYLLYIHFHIHSIFILIHKSPLFNLQILNFSILDYKIIFLNFFKKSKLFQFQFVY